MNRAVDLGVAILFVAGLYVLTRPGSQGANLVRSITGGFAQLVGVATGQQTVASPKRVRTAGGRGAGARRGHR